MLFLFFSYSPQKSTVVTFGDESIAITLDNHCNNTLLSLLYFVENVHTVMPHRPFFMFITVVACVHNGRYEHVKRSMRHDFLNGFRDPF